MSKEYSVCFFGSHPDLENDDCWTGADFDTKAEALDFYNNPKIDWANEVCSAYIEIDGPDIHEVRKNPDFIPEVIDGSDWKSEIRMQAAMGHGIQGWNDYA